MKQYQIACWLGIIIGFVAGFWESAVVARDSVGQRRGDERVDPPREADAHLGGEDRVRTERCVRPVLFRRSDRNDDLRAPF